MAEFKLCNYCGENLPLAEFYQNKIAADGRLSPCKRCYFIKNRERKNDYHRNSVLEVKQQTFAAYGDVCYCCGEDNLMLLTLDHTFNDGANLRRSKSGSTMGHKYYRRLRRAGFPQDLGLRVACWNCNAGRFHNGGICPHEEAKSGLIRLVA